MRPADSGSSEIAEGVAAVSVRSAAAVSEPVLSVAATSAASALFEALFSAAVESVAAVSAVFMAVDSPAEDSFDDCFISPFVWYSSAEDASTEVELPAPESEGSVFPHAERDKIARLMKFFLLTFLPAISADIRLLFSSVMVLPTLRVSVVDKSSIF